MKHRSARRMGVVVIAVLTAAFALSAAAGAGPVGPRASNLAFTSMKDGQADIYTMNAQGYAQVNLTHDATIGLRADSEPAWSPDGQWVVFERTYLKYAGTSVRLFVVRTNGKDLHPLMPAATNNLVADEHPAWSPDGSRIVFSSNRTGHPELFMVKANGLGLTQLTRTDNTVENLEPAWSPNGASIAYVRREWSKGPIPSIPTTSIYMLTFTTTAATSPGQRVTFPPFGKTDCQPAWSPDSKRIAFESNRPGNWDVYIVDLGLSNFSLTPVASSKYNEFHPTWSPFSNEMAFVSDRTGATEIFTAALQAPGWPTTTAPKPRQLTFDKAQKANPTWDRVFMGPAS